MKFPKLIFLPLILLILLSTVSCGICFHEYEETVIDPTCTEGGKTVLECIKCGKVKETDPTDPTGHDYTVTDFPPTCDAEGYTEHLCHCGDRFVTDILPPTGHRLSDTVTPPDCDSIGYTVHVCEVCGYEFTDCYVSPEGHTLEESILRPNCTEYGYTTYTCKCGFFYKTDFTEPKGHGYSREVVKPTCEEEGYTKYVCSCGFSYRSDFVNPKGHQFAKSVTSPDCTKEGYTTYTCECGHTYRSDEIKPLGHTLNKKVTEPTCLTEGYTTYSCECGYKYVSDPVAPKGHKFSEKVTPPTVSDMGYSVYSCSCGYSYTGNYRFYSDILDNAYANNTTPLSKGIDVSKYNHTVNSDGTFNSIDWSALKAEGVDFVILKIGSTVRGGKGGLEPTFQMDYEGAKAAGIDVGVYFFTYAMTPEEARRDAELLLSWLKGTQLEYPVYLDLEDVENENYYPSQIASPILTEMCLEFFSVLQRAGYYTGLYVNNEFLNNIMQTENVLSLFEVWYARYLSTGDDQWDTAKFGAHLGMWQYSSKGSFSLYPDIPFDLNIAYKDYPSLIKKHGFNGFSAAT